MNGEGLELPEVTRVTGQLLRVSWAWGTLQTSPPGQSLGQSRVEGRGTLGWGDRPPTAQPTPVGRGGCQSRLAVPASA